MSEITYKEVSKITLENCIVFFFSLAEGVNEQLLPSGRHKTHLVAKNRCGEILWIYEPIDPQSGKKFDILGILHYKNRMISLLTNCTSYGYDYYLVIDPSTGLVTDSYLTK